MWRLLSGIALILLLDVVFIWMMATEPDAPEIARAVGPAAAVPVLHEAPVDIPVVGDESPDDAEVRRVSTTTRSWRRSPTQRRRSFRAASSTMSVTAPANLFPDRIIWIGQTEVPVRINRKPSAVQTKQVEQDNDVQVVIADERREKKRSFPSKAAGVIKKPYELMKAFADKFN